MPLAALNVSGEEFFNLAVEGDGHVVSKALAVRWMSQLKAFLAAPGIKHLRASHRSIPDSAPKHAYVPWTLTTTHSPPGYRPPRGDPPILDFPILLKHQPPDQQPSGSRFGAILDKVKLPDAFPWSSPSTFEEWHQFILMRPPWATAFKEDKRGVPPPYLRILLYCERSGTPVKVTVHGLNYGTRLVSIPDRQTFHARCIATQRRYAPDVSQVGMSAASAKGRLFDEDQVLDLVRRAEHEPDTFPVVAGMHQLAPTDGAAASGAGAGSGGDGGNPSSTILGRRAHEASAGDDIQGKPPQPGGGVRITTKQGATYSKCHWAGDGGPCHQQPPTGSSSFPLCRKHASSYGALGNDDRKALIATMKANGVPDLA